MNSNRDQRSLFEYVVGRAIFADKLLDAATRILEMDKEDLADLEVSGDIHGDFFDMMKERYDSGRRNKLFRFASLEAQRRYDQMWNLVGLIIKENANYSDVKID